MDDTADLLSGTRFASEFLSRLHNARVGKRDMQKVIDTTSFRGRLAAFWVTGGYEPHWEEQKALEQLGDNMIGIREAAYNGTRFLLNRDIFGLGNDIPEPSGGSWIDECIIPVGAANASGAWAGDLSYHQLGRIADWNEVPRQGWAAFPLRCAGHELTAETCEVIGDEARGMGDSLPTALEAAWCMRLYMLCRGERLYEGRNVLVRATRSSFPDHPELEGLVTLKWADEHHLVPCGEMGVQVVLPRIRYGEPRRCWASKPRPHEEE